MPRMFLLIPILVLFADPAWAHDLEDGVVERDCQIVIFPDRIEFQYSLEMNAKTRDRVALAAKESKGKSKNTSKRTGLPSFPTTDPEELRDQWDNFRERFAKTLAEKIEVRIDGKQAKLIPSRSETIEKHSISLEFVLTIKHAVTSEGHSIEVTDKNFAENAGFLRVAMKGRRQVKIEDSSVPPIVSSLERTPWEELTAEQQKKRRHAKARFFLTP